ncbi:Ribokinase-like protein [Abortiporus biennis]|nr:Ribokinase-like protein [Abortiporus biennis]
MDEHAKLAEEFHLYCPSQCCIVRGSINIDEFFHVNDIVKPGETISSSGYDKRAGGKGANQAVALFKAGANVAMVGAVGKDGEWIVQGLKDFGVDVTHVYVKEKEPTGRAIIQLASSGENSIILLRGANYSQIPDTLAQRTIPHTFVLLQNEIPFQSTLSSLQNAYFSGIKTVFNPSPLPSLAQIRSFPWKYVHWLILNQGEAIGLLTALRTRIDGVKPSTPEVDPSNQDPIGTTRKVLAALRAHPNVSISVNLVCTLGSRGVLVLLEGTAEPFDEIYVPSAKLQEGGRVVDTTGAGDCFTGFFVSGLMERCGTVSRADVEAILKTAVEAAALCVQRRGAMESIPSRCEVEALRQK